MQLTIEVDGNRRTIEANGFKIYGSNVELESIRRAIDDALGRGLVQGWVGVGEVDDPKTVFPFNGRENVPTFAFRPE